MFFIFSFQNFILFLITIFSVITTTSSEIPNISERTGYSYYELRSLEEKNFCNTSDDCPDPKYSYCTSKDHTNNNHCFYHGFFCDGENNPCVYFNDDKYDYLNEKFTTEEKGSIVLKTCHIKLFEQGKCKTEPCRRTGDCVSSNCINSNCVVNGTIYQCIGKHTDFNDKKYLTCGKALNMECNSDEDCISKQCIDNFCAFKPDRIKLFSRYTALIMLIVIFIGFTLIYILHKRKDDFKELAE